MLAASSVATKETLHTADFLQPPVSADLGMGASGGLDATFLGAVSKRGADCLSVVRSSVAVRAASAAPVEGLAVAQLEGTIRRNVAL